MTLCIRNPLRSTGMIRTLSSDRLCWLALLIAGLAELASPASVSAQDQGNPNPGIAPPHSRPHGRSYGDWAANWWQAAFQTPVVAGDHPLLSGGAFGGEDGVLFLAGSSGGNTIEITIPPGTPLFFPVINAEC